MEIYTKNIYEKWNTIKYSFCDRLSVLEKRKIKKNECSMFCSECSFTCDVEYELKGVKWWPLVKHNIYEHDKIVSEEFCKFVINSTCLLKFHGNIPLNLEECEFIGITDRFDVPEVRAYCLACIESASELNTAKMISKSSLYTRQNTFMRSSKVDFSRSMRYSEKFREVAKALEESEELLNILGTFNDSVKNVYSKVGDF